MTDNREKLSELLAKLFNDAVDILSMVGSDNDPLRIVLPTGEELDQHSREDVARLVAEASNVHGRAAKLAGIAKAEYKVAHEAYKRKQRRNRIGSNEDERMRKATEATEEESERVVAAETVLSMAEGLESAARVASESARKILDKLEEFQKSESREQHGVQDSNF